MLHARFFRILAFFIFGLFFTNLLSAADNAVTIAEAENASRSEPVETITPATIKLSVEEVRLDVVVLDNRGNPITDLTAADFEVFQDGKRQEVVAAVYVDSKPGAAAQPSADEKNTPDIPLQPASPLKKEDVRRTIVFLVDDLAMTFENGHNSKMALRNFAEKLLQPGDLVAIFRTDYGNRDLNMFLSDKREVLARIAALPTAAAKRPIDDAVNDIVANKSILPGQAEFERRAFLNLMSNLSYAIQALRDMPGRKIINTMTPSVRHGWMLDNTPGKGPIYQELAFENEILDKLADEALRADIVINFLGVDGLKNNVANRADASINTFEDAFAFLMKQRLEDMRLQQPLNPLPSRTGGVLIQEGNFFLDGLGRETESLMRGYYLISYEPPPDTFKAGARQVDYRRLKVGVNRRGTTVHARDGFFGRLESEMIDDTPKNPLLAAIHSPFQSADLNVNITAGYVRDAKAGYLVRSWIHIDPEDITIVETEEGNRVNLEAIILTSDLGGNIHDSRQIEFTLSKTSVDWVKKHGIRFSMLTPIKKPGSYYVRFSVQDKESGKIGAAYQFLEIPDLGRSGLALSNIFMITGSEDLDWMRSDATKEISEGAFFPMVQEEGVISPALRTYKPGDVLHTLTTLYNADVRAIARSDLEVRTVLYRDGKEIHRGNPAAITPNDVDGSDNSVPLLRRFTLGSDMLPGNYALQIVVSDKRKNRQEGSASQTISFTVP